MKTCVAAIAMWTAMSAFSLSAELQEETVLAWNRYVALTERRIARELASEERFLVQDYLPVDERREVRRALRAGEVFTTKLRTTAEDGEEVGVPGGLVHHWVGSVFVPGVRVEELLRWLQDYDDHHRYFDDVEDSRLVSRQGESFRIFLRLRREKIVTVHYNTEHRVQYAHHGSGRASSASYATRIAEVERGGTLEETEKPVGNDHGFLWRLNSYWRFQEVDGGVIVECESVSLSRGVPAALRWLVGRYLDSVPRESMEATLLPIRREAMGASRVTTSY